MVDGGWLVSLSFTENMSRRPLFKGGRGVNFLWRNLKTFRRHKKARIYWWIDNLRLHICKISKAFFDISRIGKNGIKFFEVLFICSSKVRKYSAKKRTQKGWKTRKVFGAKVIEIPRWSMAIVVDLRICPDVSECTKTISWEDDDIVFSQYPCAPEKSPLEYHVPYSLTKNRFSQWDNTPGKSEFSGIKTPFWEKSRDKVCIEWLRHQCH